MFSSDLRMWAGIQQQRLGCLALLGPEREGNYRTMWISRRVSLTNFTPLTIIGILRIRTSDRDKSVQTSNQHSTVRTQV